jgi:hypothetical protein
VETAALNGSLSAYPTDITSANDKHRLAVWATISPVEAMLGVWPQFDALQDATWTIYRCCQPPLNRGCRHATRKRLASRRRCAVMLHALCLCDAGAVDRGFDPPSPLKMATGSQKNLGGRARWCHHKLLDKSRIGGISPIKFRVVLREVEGHPAVVAYVEM